MVSYIKDWDWFISNVRKLAHDPDCGHMEIRTVMVRSPDWVHYATRLFVPSRLSKSGAIQPAAMIYPQVALLAKEVPLHRDISYDDIVTAIQTWEELGKYTIAPLKPVVEKMPVYFHGSYNDFGELPVWTFTIGDPPNISVGNEPLLDPQLPFYHDAIEATSDWLRDPSILTNRRPTYTCRFFLTTSSAFIKDMNLEEDNTLKIKIASLLNRADLVLKLIVKKADGTVDRRNLSVEEEIPFTIAPDVIELSLYLIDKDRKLHDFFEETPYRSTWKRSVLSAQTGISDRTWLDVIGKGEGTTTEFKEWVPPHPSEAKFRELLETVIAYANTKGGVIFIGVDKNGEPRGIRHNLEKLYGKDQEGDLASMLQKYQKELTRWIRDSVAPDINLTFEQRRRGDSIVLDVTVVAGEERPYYLVEGNHIFVRRGASNIRPSPQDLKVLCPKAS